MTTTITVTDQARPKGIASMSKAVSTTQRYALFALIAVAALIAATPGAA
jgi:hypothetical protein